MELGTAMARLGHGRFRRSTRHDQKTISAEQALANIDHRMMLRPAVARPELLKFAPNGDYVTALKGGPSYLLRKQNSVLTVEQGTAPSPVGRISAPPVIFLYFHYGRTTRNRAFWSGVRGSHRRQNGPGQFGNAYRVGLPALLPDIDLVEP